MHEMAITQSILDIALSEAEKHGAARVQKIRICIGEYSGVVPQLIQEYYNIISEGTAAERAELVLTRIPVTIRCESCGAESRIDKRKVQCPQCGSTEIRLLTGREFYVDSLEVE
jgi:hydrogenase nickel incorporation protein HypA/HybF